MEKNNEYKNDNNKNSEYNDDTQLILKESFVKEFLDELKTAKYIKYDSFEELKKDIEE